MPLSEEEENQLRKIAEQFYVDDPKLADNLSSTGFSARQKQRAALGVLLFLAGLGLIVASVAIQFTPLGIFAFALMLGGSYTAWRAFGRNISDESKAFVSSLNGRGK